LTWPVAAVADRRHELPEQVFLLVGLGVTNAAVARALVSRGRQVVLVDDAAPDSAHALAAELGVTLHVAPDPAELEALIASVDAVVPAPGLPGSHPVFGGAADAEVPVLSEFDLAAAWDDRPLVAVTGTNGKTTVTTLVQTMLEASGVSCAAVGNLEVPLVAAIDDPEPACFAVEASSFRLGHSRWFRPAVAVWLNFAPDHLDVHRDLDEYRAAKARIYADQTEGDIAIVNADDPVVLAAAPSGHGSPQVVAFAGDAPGADGFTECDGVLVAPDGLAILDVTDLPRSLPHDRTNALAAAAAALAAGATPEGVRVALRSTVALPHRVQLIGERDGVRWIDDSKATAPHATLAALQGFESVVLVAGGRNKGLDLAALAEAGPRVRAVVGIGEAADEVVAAFPDRPSSTADTMSDAVLAARSLAEPGDVVLLSPGCASFDWYSSYAERGDDFTAQVRDLVLQDAS